MIVNNFGTVVCSDSVVITDVITDNIKISEAQIYLSTKRKTGTESQNFEAKRGVKQTFDCINVTYISTE